MNGHGLRILRASVWRRRQPRLDLRAPLRPLSSLRRRSNITPVLPEPSSNLTAYYESEQLAALKDAEQGSLPSESVNWKPRKQDASSIPYFTDLSRVDPFLDLSPQGIPKSGRWPMQPIPRMPTAQFRQGEEEDGSKVKELAQLTGLSVAYLETLKVRELVSHRVTNQTRLGKIAKKYVLSVAGDGNGMVGIGEASSTVSELASRLSQYQAIKNMRPIPRYENRTIYGDVVHKFGAAEVSLMSRPPGFGVRCSQYIFEICRCAGISDLAARVGRSRNPMNVIKATIEALGLQRTPEQISRGRGKKIVDVRRAYYGKGIH